MRLHVCSPLLHVSPKQYLLTVGRPGCTVSLVDVQPTSTLDRYGHHFSWACLLQVPQKNFTAEYVLMRACKIPRSMAHKRLSMYKCTTDLDHVAYNSTTSCHPQATIVMGTTTTYHHVDSIHDRDTNGNNRPTIKGTPQPAIINCRYNLHKMKA